MLWIKAFHVIAMVTWFAGLFYLPRLFVYHAMATDSISIERFKVMERKLYWGIMTPGAALTIALGLWLMGYGYKGGWFTAKLAVVLLVLIYHAYCGKLVVDFRENRNEHSHKWYRVFNEIPVLFLVAIVILVVVKPF
jgi:putative membrane protein